MASSNEEDAPPPPPEVPEERPPEEPPPEEPPQVARAWRSAGPVWGLTGLAFVYFSAIWLDAVGTSIPRRVLPQTFTYFTQIACLFPDASQVVVDYRAEGWLCGAGKWVELDVSKDFKLDAEHKENRYFRIAHFFKQSRTVMNALDKFLVDRTNERAEHGEPPGVIGGIRVSTLRHPIPPPGQPVVPFRPESIAEFTGEKKDWYWTRRSIRAARCHTDVPPDPEEKKDEKKDDKKALKKDEKPKDEKPKDEDRPFFVPPEDKKESDKEGNP